MPPSVDLKDALLVGMGLAKVGNPSRDEPLQTSRELCHFDEEEAALLTHCFLKGFRSLECHRFGPAEQLEENRVYEAAKAIFQSDGHLLKKSAAMAKHLYAHSRHPNIKSGDLCIGLLENVMVDGEATQGLCLIKSESKVPFLQVTVMDGDLRLVTQQGIYPDKVDKGCLIIDHQALEGYVVYVFDKSGGATHFWIQDFLGLIPSDDDDYHTRRYSEMCVAFAEKGLPEDVRSEERVEIANRAFDYMDEHEEFDLQEFKQLALEEPELIEQFAEFKSAYEGERGEPLSEQFVVVKETAEKAKKKLKARLKLDTGVDIRFSSGFIKESDHFLERGYDEDKRMQYVKVYYHEEK